MDASSQKNPSSLASWSNRRVQFQHRPLNQCCRCLCLHAPTPNICVRARTPKDLQSTRPILSYFDAKYRHEHADIGCRYMRSRLLAASISNPGFDCWEQIHAKAKANSDTYNTPPRCSKDLSHSHNLHVCAYAKGHARSCTTMQLIQTQSLSAPGPLAMTES